MTAPIDLEALRAALAVMDADIERQRIGVAAGHCDADAMAEFEDASDAVAEAITELTARRARDAEVEALVAAAEQITAVYVALRETLAREYGHGGWSADTMTIDKARAALLPFTGAKP